MQLKILKKDLDESILAKKSILKFAPKIFKAIKVIEKSISRGGKIIFCGNGGSAADAQHLAAELLVRLRPKVNRKPIASMTLAMDTSSLTACGNDYSFDEIFSRNLRAIGNKKDILIVITTSGNSKNIINVLKVSKKLKIQSIGFLGNNGGACKKYCNLSLIVQSDIVARIQEAHIFLGHFILEQVEKGILKK
tara:strand:- start:809 stop:1387 length:579 start_codon:yes stop_codon:yes gene_type:complete